MKHLLKIVVTALLSVAVHANEFKEFDTGPCRTILMKDHEKYTKKFERADRLVDGNVSVLTGSSVMVLGTVGALAVGAPPVAIALGATGFVMMGAMTLVGSRMTKNAQSHLNTIGYFMDVIIEAQMGREELWKMQKELFDDWQLEQAKIEVAKINRKRKLDAIPPISVEDYISLYPLAQFAMKDFKSRINDLAKKYYVEYEKIEEIVSKFSQTTQLCPNGKTITGREFHRILTEELY